MESCGFRVTTTLHGPPQRRSIRKKAANAKIAVVGAHEPGR
jgi:hypothetical protein